MCYTMTAHEYQHLRRQLGTQAEVAARLGVDRVTVAKREADMMVITTEAALALAWLLCEQAAAQKPGGKRQAKRGGGRG